MSNIFAKIFSVSGGQVLVTKDTDDEGMYLLKMTTQLDGVTPTMSAGYDDETDRDNQFDAYNQESAEQFYTNISETFG